VNWRSDTSFRRDGAWIVSNRDQSDSAQSKQQSSRLQSSNAAALPLDEQPQQSLAVSANRHTAGAIVIVVCLLALFVGLGVPPLWEPDEPRFAESTRQMLLDALRTVATGELPPGSARAREAVHVPNAREVTVEAGQRWDAAAPDELANVSIRARE